MHSRMEDVKSRSLVIRPAVVADATAIINLHYAAVHRTAAASYPPEVLNQWSACPGESRYRQMRKIIEAGDELILVAESTSGVIAFGSIVPRLGELRAVYVHPDTGRIGIGSQILAALERLAVDRGVYQLQMDSSVNAEAFYVRAGYEVIERGVHRLRTGQDMACVRMKKELKRGRRESSNTYQPSSRQGHRSSPSGRRIKQTRNRKR